MSRRGLFSYWMSSSFFINQNCFTSQPWNFLVFHILHIPGRQIPPWFTALVHTYPPTTLIPGVSPFILMELDKAWIWPALFIHAVNAVTVHPSHQTQDSHSLQSQCKDCKAAGPAGVTEGQEPLIKHGLCAVSCDLYRLAGKS